MTIAALRGLLNEIDQQGGPKPHDTTASTSPTKGHPSP